MNEKAENVWRKALIWGALTYGSMGLVMMIVVLVLPTSFHEGAWNDPLIAGASLRVVVFGGGIGAVWALFLIQQRNPIMVAIIVLFGILLWLIGEELPWIPPAISIPLGLILGWSATRDLLKKIEKVKGYSSKSGVYGEERKQIIKELFEAIGTSKSDTLRTTAARALKAFGKDGIEPLLNHLENPNPKARQRIVDALGVVGNKEAIPSLQSLLATEQDSAVKQSAQNAIENIQNG